MERARRYLATCLLVAVLVTAGCQAPLADANNTVTATESGSQGPGQTVGSAPNVTVVGESLELDPGNLFAQLQTLSGTNATAPETVRVYESAEAFYGNSSFERPPFPRFWEVVGLRTEAVNGSTREIQKNGYVTGTGTVVVYLSPNTTLADERFLLAHEFTHYIQTRTDRHADLTDALGIETTQASYIRRSIVEGTAVFTADAYVREYAPGEKLNSPWYTEIQASYPPGHVARLQNGRYIHGYEYVNARADSPANLSAIYENPPRTTEQLLHGRSPGEEPPTPLDVRSRTDDTWLASGTDVMGEGFIRYALAGEVNHSRATRAAAGWGNDSLHIFRPLDGETTGYVWVLDWDDPANATEFERTYRATLNDRGNATGGVWSLSDVNASASVVEVGEETTAVVFGPEPFVTETTVDSSGGSVSIDVGDVSSARDWNGPQRVETGGGNTVP